MLNSRMIVILRELMSIQSTLSTVTSEYLATVNQVSSRTIRTDIKQLDDILSQYGAKVKSARGTGYELSVLDEKQFHQLLKELSANQLFDATSIPTVPDDRVHYLIKRLLLADEYLKLEDLADELYISKSTIQNDLRDVKKQLCKYDILLEKRPNYGLKAKGDEMKMRFCMSEYIFNRKDKEIDMVYNKISILPQESILTIKAHILNQIKRYNIMVSDIGLNNLIIHLAIACKRIQEENFISLYSEDLLEIMEHKEYEVAAEIVREIENAFKIRFPKSETAYIAIHLLGTKMLNNSNHEEKEVKQFIDTNIYELTAAILEAIEKELHLGISEDSELILGMSLHLKPAINRYKYGMNLRNPMLEGIKSHYPLAFEAGIIAGKVLKNRLEIDMHETEIGYLALHIGGAIERRKIINQPKRCLIVCASGVGSAKLLSYKLQATFGLNLTILGTTQYYKLHQMSLHSLDFIVSTIPIPDHLPVPVVQVSTILGNSDFKKIDCLMKNKQQPSLEYTKKELVYLQQEFQTREEVLHFLGEKLTHLGLVPSQFIESVFEREAASPTSFGNLVAIPHPMVPQTDTTFWAICTLKKPIMWEGNLVQFICLLSVKANNQGDLQKMYSLLVRVVDDKQVVQRLVKCKDYEEFIEVFMKNIR